MASRLFRSFLSLEILLGTAPSVEAAFSIDQSGYFRNGSRFFMPVGVNYWPGSVGSELWYKPFPAEEIRRDFAIVRATGFNALRLFLTWPVFQTSPDTFNRTAFGNLIKVMEFARAEGLAVDLSVFVGGMSGKLYWPNWVKGNIYTDRSTKDAMEMFALKVARTVKSFRDILFALEHGNEMNNVGTNGPNVTTAEVVAWTRAIYDAFKEGCPGVPVVPGVGDGAIVRSGLWPLGGVTGRIAADTLNFHPYAVLFEPTRGDGLLDKMTHATTGYNTAFVRAHGPAFMQEWGTLVTGGARQTDGYLRGVLPAALANGANGFLWWCMRDIENTDVEPYSDHGKETLLGLYKGRSDQLKPGHEFLVEFANKLTSLTGPPQLPENDPAAIGLYLPAHHTLRDDPANPGNEPGVTVMAATIAYHFIQSMSLSTRVVRGDLPLPKPRTELQTMIITSSFLTDPEIRVLQKWVRDGGHLLWHGLATHAFSEGSAAAELVGASSAGPLKSGELSVEFGGQLWSLKTDFRVGGSVPKKMAASLINITAKRMWKTNTSTVIATLNSLGKGIVFASAAPVEASIEPTGLRAVRDRWAGWYKSALACLRHALECDAPSVSSAHVMQAPSHMRVEIGTTQGLDTIASLVVAVYSSGDSKDMFSAKKARKTLSGLGHKVVELTSPIADVPSNASVVILPSQEYVLIPDQGMISSFVKSGGCVLWHGVSYMALSAVGFDMIGAAAVDYRTPVPSLFEVFGRNWTLDRFQSNTPVHVELDHASAQRKTWGTAEKLAIDDRGIATVLRNRWGGGHAITTSPAVELSLADAQLIEWYRSALSSCHTDGGVLV